MSEIAKLGANDMVLGITGTNGVTYNLDDITTAAGQKITFSRTLNINPGAEEIPGVQYQSIANALTYIGTQTPVPSDTNRWSLTVSGTLAENIDLTNMAYIHIAGTGNAILTGTVDNTASTSGYSLNELITLKPWAIYNCTVNNVSPTEPSMIAFVDCKVTGSSISPSGLVLLWFEGGSITGGSFTEGIFVIIKSFITGGTFGGDGAIFIMTGSTVVGAVTVDNAFVHNTSFTTLTDRPVVGKGTYYNCLFGDDFFGAVIWYPENGATYTLCSCILTGVEELDLSSFTNFKLEFRDMHYPSIKIGTTNKLVTKHCYSGGTVELLGGEWEDVGPNIYSGTGAFNNLMIPGKTPVNAVAATGSISVTGTPGIGDTISVGGVTFSFVNERSADREITISADPATQAANIREAITEDMTTVSAAVNSSVTSQVDLTAATKGSAGNSITLYTYTTAITISGATLTGGINGTVGAAGEVCIDASYVYYCTADNTVAGANWRRLALSTSY